MALSTILLDTLYVLDTGMRFLPRAAAGMMTSGNADFGGGAKWTNTDLAADGSVRTSSSATACNALA
eukprot:433720-Lingulodinium_polyedra.AAC.1